VRATFGGWQCFTQATSRLKPARTATIDAKMRSRSPWSKHLLKDLTG
jgi:hypothetical protein